MEETTSSTTLTEASSSGAETQSGGSILGGMDSGQEASPLAINMESLPDDIRHEPVLKNFKSWDALAKSYVHANRKLGVPSDQLMQIPQGENADWNGVYKAMGRPDTPDQYELNGTGEMADNFRNQAHQLGLSQKQASELMNWYSEVQSGVDSSDDEDFASEQVQWVADLQKEWGDSYIKNTKLAERAFRQFGSEDALEVMNATGLGSHPALVKMFSQIGQFLAEDGQLTGNQQGRIGGITPGSAKTRIDELLNDKDFTTRYYDQYHPRHQDAVNQMQRLYEAAG